MTKEINYKKKKMLLITRAGKVGTRKTKAEK